MKFIFYQNILSMHQSALLKQLSKKYEVILIVEKSEISEERNNMGWELPQFGNCKILVNPDFNVVEKYFFQKENIHIFTGIDGFPFVYSFLKRAIKCNAYIGIQMESFDNIGIKGFFRLLKYKFISRKIGKHIKFILAMGEVGVKSYIKSGFLEDKVFEWGYFVDFKKYNKNKIDQNTKPNILFVGRIDNNKNLLPLIKKMHNFENYFNSFNVIGTGPLKNELNVLIYDRPKFNFIGKVDNSKVYEYMAQADLVILPSLYDGWGAVVNESLSVGTPVLCSKNCGAETLIGGNRGAVFHNINFDYDVIFKKIISELPLKIEEREEIINWVKLSISANSAVEYLEKIIRYNQGSLSIKPIAPWKK